MTDTFTSRVAAVALAVGFLGLIGVIALLAWDSKEVPAVLAGALGLVLGGLLPSPITKTPTVVQPGDVHVQNVMPSLAGTAPAKATAKGRSQRGGISHLLLLVLAAIGLLVVLAWIFS